MTISAPPSRTRKPAASDFAKAATASLLTLVAFPAFATMPTVESPHPLGRRKQQPIVTEWCDNDIQRQLEQQRPRRTAKTREEMEKLWVWQEQQRKAEYQRCTILTRERRRIASERERAEAAARRAAEKHQQQEQAKKDRLAARARFEEQEQCKRDYVNAIRAEAERSDAVTATGPTFDGQTCSIELRNNTRRASILVTFPYLVTYKDGRAISLSEQPFLGPQTRHTVTIGLARECAQIATVTWTGFRWTESGADAPDICLQRRP